MISVSEHGPLSVAWTAKPRNAIERELRGIDDHLFLDPESDGQRVFWTVKYWNGERAPAPVTLVVDWRDPQGLPRDLSDGLLYEVRRLVNRGPLDLQAITERNRALKERRADEVQAQYAEIAQDFWNHQAIGNFAVVPRSLKLAQTRAKMRASGIQT